MGQWKLLGLNRKTRRRLIVRAADAVIKTALFIFVIVIAKAAGEFFVEFAVRLIVR